MVARKHVLHLISNIQLNKNRAGWISFIIQIMSQTRSPLLCPILHKPPPSGLYHERIVMDKIETSYRMYRVEGGRIVLELLAPLASIVLEYDQSDKGLEHMSFLAENMYELSEAATALEEERMKNVEQEVDSSTTDE